uniref:Ubiquitinyl hydrolase 1 n=1 Tax=Heterorhabditis bacteriophora TaxID=37862 RepID=A0A1I7WTM5_HETBA
MITISLRKDLKPLTNLDLEELVKELKIEDFRGVFMRDTLSDKILSREVGIVNLDSSNNKGTHWVCYKKKQGKSYYFDSFALDPPEEIINYLKNNGEEDNLIESSTFQIQAFGTHNCGESMLTTLIVCVCLATKSHAGIIVRICSGPTRHEPSKLLIYICNLEFSSSSTSTSPPNTPQRITEAFCDKDAELAKISCLSSRDHEEIWSGILKHGLARILNAVLIKDALILIGKEELRKALNLSPPHPWAPYNSTKPSEAEIASAPTLEAYFDLKEPRAKVHSLDSFFFYEHNFPPAIAFLDKRVPVIRTVFRCRFEKMRSVDVAGVTDRQKIDLMIAELLAIHDKVDRAIRPMFNIQCMEE